MSIKSLMATLSLSILTAIATPHASAGLTYEIVDVADPTPAVNRVKTIYHLDGAFAMFGGFNVLFDPALYANVTLTSPLGPDWFAITFQQPDAGLGLDGILNYLALNDIADATAAFEVEYDYLVAGVPGPQPYELYDASLNVTAARTTAFGAVAVPEPATSALILAGLLLLSRRHAWRQRAVAPART
jgi:hypothetical protein